MVTNILVLFVSTYLWDQSFSRMLDVKTKKTNKVSCTNEMSVTLAKVKPRISYLATTEVTLLCSKYLTICFYFWVKIEWFYAPVKYTPMSWIRKKSILIAIKQVLVNDHTKLVGYWYFLKGNGPLAQRHHKSYFLREFNYCFYKFLSKLQ